MKKYIAPSLQVVNIQNENILAGSSENLGTGSYNGQTPLARGHRGLTDDWDDED